MKSRLIVQLAKIRPFVTGIIARNGSLDDESIKQLINMQEDLHFGLGRKRKKSSIGIHDLDRHIISTQVHNNFS